MISAAVVVLIFIGNARTDREYLSTYQVDTVDGRAPYSINIPDVGMLSNVNFISPNTVNSMTKVIAQMLFIAPRLVTASWRLGKRTGELSGFDPPPASQIVEHLRMSTGRVSFAKLFPATGSEMAPAALGDLQMLDAIQFLDSHLPGVMLTSAFREALNTAEGI